MGDAAELGRRFVERLTSGGVVENCHLREFKFIFLSFVHYLHLIKEKFPDQNVEQMLNMNATADLEMNPDMPLDDDGVHKMNDDILMKMFENEKVDESIDHDEDTKLDEIKCEDLNHLDDETKIKTNDDAKDKDESKNDEVHPKGKNTNSKQKQNGVKKKRGNRSKKQKNKTKRN